MILTFLLLTICIFDVYFTIGMGVSKTLNIWRWYVNVTSFVSSTTLENHNLLGPSFNNFMSWTCIWGKLPCQHSPKTPHLVMFGKAMVPWSVLSSFFIKFNHLRQMYQWTFPCHCDLQLQLSCMGCLVPRFHCSHRCVWELRLLSPLSSCFFYCLLMSSQLPI